MTGAVFIGSSSASAQRPSPPAGSVPIVIDFAQIESHFRTQLDPARSERWRRAFVDAQALGDCAVDSLAELAHRRRADPREWLLCHAAIAAAGGEAADTLLLRALAGTDNDRLQFGLAMLLAMGRGGFATWELGGPALERLSRGAPIVQAAALLARNRLRGAPRPPSSSYDAIDTAVAAAARLCGSQVETKSIRRDRPDLLQRAEWLGAVGTPIAPSQLEAIRDVLSHKDPAGRAARIDAAIRLAATDDPSSFGTTLRGLEPEVATVLASNPAWRRSLAVVDLVPVDRIEPPWRNRAALAFVLLTDGAALRDAAGVWASDRDTAAVGHLALAWRLLRARLAGVEDAVDLAWASDLPDHGCREWVRLAGGGRPLTRVVQTGVVEIDRLLTTWSSDRLLALGERAMFTVTERALTSLGAHLGSLRRERELELIAELTLFGSHHAAAVLGVDATERLRPRGIPLSDEVFAIVFEYWRFVRDAASRRDDPGRLR
jgi:hypothetical protein